MFSQNIFAGGPEKFFSAGPELASGGPEECSGTDCNRLRTVSHGWL